MSVAWNDIAAIVSVVGFLLGLATIYLRLSITTATTEVKQQVMNSVHEAFVRRDINELHLKDLWRRIRQIEARIERKHRAGLEDDPDDDTRRHQ